MKQKILLSMVMAASITTYAQTEKKVTGYAITGDQYGYMNWKSVKLIDFTTGEEIKSFYTAGQAEPELLNARTGKAIVKKEVAVAPPVESDRIKVTIKSKDGGAGTTYTFNSMEELKASQAVRSALANSGSATASNKSAQLNDNSQEKLTSIIQSIEISKSGYRNDRGYHHGYSRGYGRGYEPVVTEEPFATGSTALAYDKKHDRLYYTPMGINQLRYIDLKSKTPKVYYFEDETFGVSTGSYDIGSQITRMVIASDGNGYALSNNNEHLMRFTTGKKAEIADLGALVDDAANGENTIISNRRSGFGGDMIADADDNIYLINQNRKVFKIVPATKIATYLGTIEGLPYNYSTNGVMVEAGSNIIVGSSGSDEGYYRVDMKTLQAEKVSTSGTVYKISDLASGNLLFEKERSKEEIMPVLAYQAKAIAADATNGIAVYPNPVKDKLVKLSFANQPAGEYQIQLMELSGKVMSVRNVTINSKVQQVQFNLPQGMAKGSYLVKTISDVNKVSVISKLIVE